MFEPHILKNWISWPHIRAHLCTLAIAVSFNSTWRVPREGYRYGGFQYALLLTVAMVTVALPISLLQLAIGQLSQQDVVGVWRAVPFFKGLGYIKLLVSFIGSIYTIIHLAITITNFLYAISNSIPFPGCTGLLVNYNDSMLNASRCINETFMAPVQEKPEYYMAISFIIIILSVIFPFMLYNPVKLMKRIFYGLGLLVVIMYIVIMSCIGERAGMRTFVTASDWSNFLQPNIWYSAVITSLLNNQVAGGYLISAGDSVYTSMDVQWTALTIVGANIVSNWMVLLMWFAIGGEGYKDTSSIAVLIQIYNSTEERNLNNAYPLLVLAMLLISGVITMLTLLYPLYDRFRRIGGYKWRTISMSNSAVSAGAALGVLAAGLPALTMLEDTAVPFLISITIVVEILAFILIYGLQMLMEDVEFLIGRQLLKYWAIGWWTAPVIIMIFTSWWLVKVTVETVWTEPPWQTIAVIACTGTSMVIFIIFSSVSVTRQVQYDYIGKLKSSFVPSRHWGPRDPISHYYWLARRENAGRGNLPQTTFRRRQPGQLSGGVTFLNIPETTIKYSSQFHVTDKRKTSSDDWLYTGYRKQHVAEELNDIYNKKRSMSLEWKKDADVTFTKNMNVVEAEISNYDTPDDSIVSLEEENIDASPDVKELNNRKQQEELGEIIEKSVRLNT